MSDSSEEHICPNCGGEMIDGSLKDASETVHIETFKSREGSVLRALVCPA